MLQSFSTEIAQPLIIGITNLETYISNLGDTISAASSMITQQRLVMLFQAWFSRYI